MSLHPSETFVNPIPLQHLQSDRQSGASSKLFLNLMIQFY